MHLSDIKEQIGKKAASFVQDGMIIGLGTGSTAAAFIHALKARMTKEPLKIVCVATSLASEQLALSLNIPCTSIDAITAFDITFDGADEIDLQKRMIKGAGGALLREKIIAKASKEVLILVEEKKCVDTLGKAKLPVEIVPFGHKLTVAHLAKLGYHSTQRKNPDNAAFITDNGNFILDIQLSNAQESPEDADLKIRSVPGVVETGFFFHLANRIIIGKNDGTVEVVG